MVVSAWFRAWTSARVVLSPFGIGGRPSMMLIACVASAPALSAASVPPPPPLGARYLYVSSTWGAIFWSSSARRTWRSAWFCAIHCSVFWMMIGFCVRRARSIRPELKMDLPRMSMASSASCGVPQNFSMRPYSLSACFPPAIAVSYCAFCISMSSRCALSAAWSAKLTPVFAPMMRDRTIIIVATIFPHVFLLCQMRSASNLLPACSAF